MKKFLFFVGCLGLLQCQPHTSFDLIITGGAILDGSGSESFQADLGIREGKIVFIGKLKGNEGTEKIDGRGKIISPGFIDLHTHLEPLMEMPDATSHVMQGVTTALGGPDGGGPWPFGAYLDSLENYFHLGMNVAYLAGHNVIRKKVMGLENRDPSPAELQEMKEMVSKAMDEGAFGLSTGLKYLPGTFSKTEEVIVLANQAGKKGGIYTSHLREEGLGLFAGVREAIEIGKNAHLPVVLTHHKAIGKPMWGKSVVTLALVDSARNAGIDVMMDQYPYTASHTGLSVLIPAWSLDGGAEKFLERTQNKILKDSILSGITFNILNDRGGGDLKLIQFARVSWDSSLEGKTLYDYALGQQVEPNAIEGAKLVLGIQLKGGANCIFHAMGEEDVERIMSHPFTMHASDGSLTAFGVGHPHPRAYGTFPRVLGYYVREKKILTLEEAIRKMTSMPAARLGLKNRGLVKKGYQADLVIFDPNDIGDQATFEKPHQYPKGIFEVIVNGIRVVREGKMTEARGGKVLRGGGYLGIE